MKISEIFYSLQGEGYFTGTAMAFVRTYGCNLKCSWCDSSYAIEGKQFVEMTPQEVLQNLKTLLFQYPAGPHRVCFTGGEPFLQPDLLETIRLCHCNGIEVHIESNGTIPGYRLPNSAWLTISPKKQGPDLDSSWMSRANEIKLILDDSINLNWIKSHKIFLGHLFIQPESERPEMVKLAIEFIKENPRWRLSLQTHKMLNIP